MSSKLFEKMNASIIGEMPQFHIKKSKPKIFRLSFFLQFV